MAMNTLFSITRRLVVIQLLLLLALHLFLLFKLGFLLLLSRLQVLPPHTANIR